MTFILSFLRTGSFLPVYITLLSTIGILANAILFPALPLINQEFSNASYIAEWITTTFLLGATVGQFIWGSISDFYGRERPLYWGIILTLISSLFCYYADTETELLVGRFLQGIGATSGNAIGRALCRDYFQEPFFTRMIARVFMAIPLASGIAPMLGSIFNNIWGWRSTFLFIAVFSIIIFALTALLLESKPYISRTFSSSKIARDYKTILSDKTNLFILACISSIFIIFFIFLTSLPLLLDRSFTSESWISFLLMAFPLGIFIGGFYQSTWGWRSPWEKVLYVCWTIIALSLLASFIVLLTQGSHMLSLYVTCMMFFGGSMSIVNSLISTLFMKRHPPEMAGTLSSIVGVTQTLSSALGSFWVIFTHTSYDIFVLMSLLTGMCFLTYLFLRKKVVSHISSND